jgi:hypothetical protein
MPRPRFRSLVLSASGVIFVGGVAAAATGGGLTSFMDGIESGPTTTVAVTSTTLADTSLAVEEGDALTDDEIAAICAEAANHGEGVSTVAKDDGAQGREHGELVSKVAKSDCGKTDADDDDTDSDAPTTTEADDTPGLTDEELEAICDAAENHGEAVSTVAKDKSTVGREHGELVSKMAHSNCGKGGDDDETTVSANANKGKKHNGGVQGS